MSAPELIPVTRPKILLIGVLQKSQKGLLNLPFDEAQIFSVPDARVFEDVWPLIDRFGPDLVICGSNSLQYFRQKNTSLSNPVHFLGLNEDIIKCDHGARQTPKLIRFDNARLTDRHKDILIMLHAGLRNREIAVQLSISIRSVKSSLAELFLLFDVSNRTELLGSAIDLGVLSK
jgi:DNA-binding CsgD family transcriptional regulator